MGLEINQTDFSPEDYQQFSTRLDDSLAVLEALLKKPGFGQGEVSYGAELELYLVDAQGRTSHVNEQILRAADDPLLTLELNRYNLEYNLKPYAIAQQAFSQSEADIVAAVKGLNRIAADFDTRVVPVGILPTLNKADFSDSCITDRQRYRALVQQLNQRRGEQFLIDINGLEPLKLGMDNIALEGANTSFQVHYRVAPERFVDTYNAIQLATPLALALGGNSPGLFGHRLWAETRIPLFKQSIDTRDTDRYQWSEPARVHFGNGWLRDTLEGFRELVRLYEPLLPVCSDRCPHQEYDSGQVPALDEFRLHQSTVWLWNRPIYDPAAGGMLRIEMRALPAGPTAVDMIANSAFLIGLAEGLLPNISELLPALPFRMAEYNFYRSAQWGLDANIVWPDSAQSRCRERPVTEVIEQMLPVAEQGLSRMGVDANESRRYLDVIEQRLRNRQTGARWQLLMHEKLATSQPKALAARNMLEMYMINSNSNEPVSQWLL